MPAENTVRNVHIDQALTNLSVGYHPQGMIAEKVVAVIPVKHESDFFYKWNKGDALRRVDTRRADGTRANRVEFGFTRDSYLCEEYALEWQITDRTRRNADSQLNLEISTTRRLQDLLLLDQEVRVANLLGNYANYAATNKVTLTGTDQWNNAAFAGNVEKVIDDAKDAVRKVTGNNARPAIAIIPESVALVLKRDAKVRDILKYTHSDLLVNGDLPPRIWNLDIVIPSVVENTALDIYNTDNFTGADIWGKNVILTMKPTAPSVDTLAHAYIFRNRDSVVETWRDEPISSDWYRVSYIQAEKTVSDTAGYMIAGVIA